MNRNTEITRDRSNREGIKPFFEEEESKTTENTWGQFKLNGYDR